MEEDFLKKLEEQFLIRKIKRNKANINRKYKFYIYGTINICKVHIATN